MIKILFICHGNICRSPMAEFLFRDLAEKAEVGDFFFVRSAATSTEELGNSVHPGTRKKLAEIGISVEGKRACRVTAADCDEFDYLIAMDSANVRNLAPFLGNNGKKVSLLMDYTGTNRAIADPWYTHNFDETYRDVLSGCRALLAFLRKKHGI